MPSGASADSVVNVHDRRPQPIASVAFDVLLALGIVLLDWTLAVSLTRNMGSGMRSLALAAMSVSAGSVAFRRLRPWPAFIVSIAAGLLALGAGLPMVALTVGPVVMVYSISAQFPGARSLVALAVSWAAFFAAETLQGFGDDLSTIVTDLVILAAAWLIGWFVFRRQEYVRELETKTAELQEAREELARAAVSAERLRIARELHDIVAHSLSMISVQAGVGAHVIDSRPEEARAALANVETASRQALNEMRALLGMLRDTSGEPDRAPLPGLSQLPALIQQVSTAGPEVELQVHGAERPLAPGMDLTAYRVIQESLTNVLRHADAERARVILSYEPAALVIEVVDDGTTRATVTPNGGLGIEGMRERLQAFGGTLEAAPLRENGFRVRAELPLGKQDA